MKGISFAVGIINKRLRRLHIKFHLEEYVMGASVIRMQSKYKGKQEN
jgi:hypothetical protein